MNASEEENATGAPETLASHQPQLKPLGPPEQSFSIPNVDQHIDVCEEIPSTSRRVLQWIIDRVWAPPNGSQRIWYLCVSMLTLGAYAGSFTNPSSWTTQGCGRHTYIDVEELEPGGVRSVRESILQNANAVRRGSGPSQTVTSPGSTAGQLGLTSPSPTSSGSSPSRGFVPVPSAQVPASTLPRLPALNPTSASREMHLLVCVDGRQYETLAKVGHLDINDSWNDGMLLRGLLRENKRARQDRQWSIASLLPALPKKAENSRILSYLRTGRIPNRWWDSPIWQWLCSRVPEGGLWAPLYMPSTADFVKVTRDRKDVWEQH